MIASVLLTGMLLIGPQGDGPSPILSTNVPLGRLTIPDEIAPAVVPYLRCRLLSQGVRMGPPGAQEIPTAQQVGADCSGARREAARLGERMLKSQRRGSSAERRAFVEKTLASVDNFAGKSIAMPPAPESRSRDPK